MVGFHHRGSWGSASVLHQHLPRCFFVVFAPLLWQKEIFAAETEAWRVLNLLLLHFPKPGCEGLPNPSTLALPAVRGASCLPQGCVVLGVPGRWRCFEAKKKRQEMAEVGGFTPAPCVLQAMLPFCIRIYSESSFLPFPLHLPRLRERGASKNTPLITVNEGQHVLQGVLGLLQHPLDARRHLLRSVQIKTGPGLPWRGCKSLQLQWEALKCRDWSRQRCAAPSKIPVPCMYQPFSILSTWRCVGFLILAASRMKDPINSVILVRSTPGETSGNPAAKKSACGPILVFFSPKCQQVAVCQPGSLLTLHPQLEKQENEGAARATAAPGVKEMIRG